MGRVPWQELPEPVRRWASQVLGAPVTGAVSQPGGFSPGAACRLRLADGRRAFMKAVSVQANPDSPDMHRREAVISARLPAGVGAPALLGCYDRDGWVALLYTDAGGRQPHEPWEPAELDRVLAAIGRLHAALTPALPEVASVADLHADSFTGWRSLATVTSAGRAAGLDDWSSRHLDRLAELEAAWPRAATGGTLLHGDLRADNILLRAGQVTFVDWASACTGAPVFDVAAFAPSVTDQGGPDPEWILAHSGAAAGVRPDDLTALVSAIAGYFTRQSLLAPPPGLPTVRAIQAAQGEPARAWLRRLTGRS